MASSKAFYWLALAVLALGLNNEYQRGRMQPLHRLVSRSEATINCLAMRAREYVVLAKVMLSDRPGLPDSTELAQAVHRERAEFARIRPEMVRQQVRLELQGVDRAQFVRLGAEMARHQAEFARLRTEQARVIVEEMKHRKAVACKESGFKVTVNDEDEAPVVEVVDNN